MNTFKKQGSSILVVDDEPKIRKLLKNILVRNNFDVIEAENGSEALQILDQQGARLIITDVNMPLVSGFDLLSMAKKKHPGIPVILVTGKASVEAAVQCMKIGAADYISKPFKMTQIEEVVRKTLTLNDTSLPPDIDSTMFDNDLSVIYSRYRIIRKLGEGAMGVVYLARDTRNEDVPDAIYAVKLFKRCGLSPKELRDLENRFLHEVKAISSVSHPNVVRIIDYGIDQNAMDKYIVMEYLEGFSLKDYLLNPIPEFDLETKIHILSQIAAALVAVHSVNIFHRDIKPANIMIIDGSTVKLADFGVARLPESDLTQKTDLIGSPGYMSPESFRSAVTDQRADIFSFGILAYEFILGKHPFPAESLYLLAQLIQYETPPDPREIQPDLPDNVRRIILKMIEKDPEQRYQTVEHVKRDLDDCHSRWISKN